MAGIHVVLSQKLEFDPPLMGGARACVNRSKLRQWRWLAALLIS